MAHLAIKGHATRGYEVIEILEMLGGKREGVFLGNLIDVGYYIDSKGYINYWYANFLDNIVIYTVIINNYSRMFNTYSIFYYQNRKYIMGDYKRT